MGPRKVLSLTHVLYEEGSPLSLLLAIATLSPLFVGCSLVALFLVTRRLQWAWALLGLALMDAICVVMKHEINEPRPMGSYRDGPGMPSEHAAFMVFLSTHFGLWVAIWFRCSLRLKALAWLSLAAWSFTVIYSRSHLGVHTAEQLAAGTVLGMLGGATWFRLEAILRPVLVELQRGLDRGWHCLGIVVCLYETKKDAQS